MLISAIDCFPVKLTFREPFVIANGSFSDLFYVLLRLRTDTGVTGYGEAIPAWEVTGETVLGVIDAVGHVCDPRRTGIRLVGRRIDTLRAVRGVMADLNPTDRPQAVWGAPGAKAALEAAMLDALGRHTGLPVYALLGGANARVPVADVIGIHPVEETLRRVEAAVWRAPPVIKLKVGVADVGGLSGFGRDVAVVRQAAAMVAAGGHGTLLAADANQGFVTPEEAAAFARQVAGCLAWLEQPALADDRTAFREIRRRTDTKLMADESVHSHWDAQLLMDLGGIDYLNLKLMKTGGTLEALRIADTAAERGVVCQMGSMLESQVGTAAGAHTFLAHPNIATTELCSLRMLREALGSGVQAEPGGLRLSDAPGLGVRVAPSEIDRFRLSPDDLPAYRRAVHGFPQ